MTLYHTSVLQEPTSRNLLAAWMELEHLYLPMSLSVAEQLAPITASAIGTTAELAERLLENQRTNGWMENRQLAEEAWWNKVWRERDTPYEVMRLSHNQDETVTALLHEIDPRGFPGCPPDQVRSSPAARTVCETVVLGGWLCLRDNLGEIDSIEINRWAIENGHRENNASSRLLYDADMTFVNWTYEVKDIQRLLQASLLACWPDDDNAPARDVLRRTRGRIAAMTRTETLPATGQRILNCLTTHPDPLGLVEDTRTLLPSPTVNAERLHPNHHAGPQAPQPHQAQAPRDRYTDRNRTRRGNTE
jgi:hypothetical protein